MKSIFIKIFVLLFLISCGSQQDDEQEISDILATPQGHWIQIKRDTWLKKRTSQASDLKTGSEKCLLKKNERVLIQESPILVGSHYNVNTTKIRPGCGFSKGYVYNVDVTSTSGGGSSGAKVKAFFDVIGFAEGTGSAYNIRFGGAKFSSFQGHPRLIYCAGSLCSDAAGRYQFLSTTWDNLRSQISLPSFAPENQDRGCIQLIKNAGAYDDLLAIGSREGFRKVINLTNQVWASFPGSPYGQPTKNFESLWQKYETSRKKY